MAVRRTKSGRIDKHTKEGKATFEDLVKAYVAAARERCQEDANLPGCIKRMLE